LKWEGKTITKGEEGAVLTVKRKKKKQACIRGGGKKVRGRNGKKIAL